MLGSFILVQFSSLLNKTLNFLQVSVFVYLNLSSMQAGLSVLTFILETSLCSIFVLPQLFFSFTLIEVLHILIIWCCHLYHTLLTCRIWWVPNNASRWQMRFNLVFKVLALECFVRSDIPEVMINVKRHFCINCGTAHGINYQIFCVYWTVHHLDSWINRDQLDVTCFFISLFHAQHVSDVSTSILRSLRLICWVISWVVLLWYNACWCYIVVWLEWCGIRMQAEAV